MNYENAIFYNESSAAKLGWSPQWFGCTHFDEELCDSISNFQNSYGLVGDGMCGANTFRRIFNERESEISTHEPVAPSDGNHIVFNSEHYPIDWRQVVCWDEPQGLQSYSSHHRREVGEPRDIRMFVNHWDVCLTSKICHKVLSKRGISVHFLIDWDGTIYQTMDMQHVAWHAGGRNWNNWSVGVEICNPYYEQYQEWYEKRGVSRPIVEDAECHGTPLERHLGFFAVQLEALRALSMAVHAAAGVPLVTPDTTTVYPPAVSGEFRGFISHYHLTHRKIDCAGLKINEIIRN